MTQTTSLYQQHLALNALMVNFAGWKMPMHYGSQIEEHHAVRKSVGIFDVSHMVVVDISGSQSVKFLRLVLANDIAKLKTPGQALYTCMLNPQGGVIDDLIVYFLEESVYRVILNAACYEKDWAWLNDHKNDYVHLDMTLRDDLAMIAIQGPDALSVVKRIIPDQETAIDALKPFSSFAYKEGLVARTGYTGEDGVEMIIPHALAQQLWQDALADGVRPCGLGARDTLRLEAGLNLYGQDMTEQTTPFESNLGWTVCFKDEERHFIGKTALLKQQQLGVSHELVGVIMKQRGMLRNHQDLLFPDNCKGEITSGSFSPTLNHSIALARIPKSASGDAYVDRRGVHVAVEIVRPPFVRKGKICIE